MGKIGYSRLGPVISVEGEQGEVDLVAGSGIIITGGGDGTITFTTDPDYLLAQSGSFPQGVVLRAPNGSGWLTTVADDGVLTTAGPFILE